MHTNNTPAFEAVYDTNNIVLCDVHTGPASLGLSLDNIVTGQAFRTIDAALTVLGAHGAFTVYHLLLPPGSAPPTTAAIKAYSDEDMLTLGGAVRGRFHARAGEKRMRYAIDRSLCPSPLPDETGPIDGFCYDCYFYAEDALGKGSYIVKYKNSVMAMPFHMGRGTLHAPFCIRELDAGELSSYPDLMPGHPLNSAGVAQSARMLDNIGRLQALYGASGGVSGLRGSLSLSYSLHAPIDLEGYQNAYGGRGWRPIGCFDEHDGGAPQAFSGKLTGGGTTTPIRNLSLTSRSGGVARDAGLFWALDKARIADIAIQGASIFIVAGGAKSDAQCNAGALAGSVKSSELSSIRLERIRILAASAAPGCRLRLGGLSGYASGSVSLRDCRAKSLLIADMNTNMSAAGGLFGELSSFRQTAIMEDIAISDARLFGWSALGGAIGHIRGAVAVRRADLYELALNIENMGAGGFAGLWETLGSLKPRRLEAVTVCRLSVTALSAQAAQSGGLIGGLTVSAPMQISGCTVTQSCIDCPFACGGFLGQASSDYEGYLTVEDSAAQANVSGAYMIGGFAGALHSAGLFSRCHAAGGGVCGVLALGGFAGCTAFTRYQGCETLQPVRPYSKLALIEGGFVGLSQMSAYEDCHAKGDVDTLLGFAGGFAGIQAGSADEQRPAIVNQFIRCSARGDVKGVGAYSTMVGGFMGLGTLFLLRECYAGGAVISSAHGMGGLVAGIFCGANAQCLLKPIIEDCYSVSGLQGAGSAAPAGGLVGCADYVAIRRCCYSGSILAQYPLGGIIAKGSEDKGAVEVSGCLLLEGSLSGNQADACRCMGENADAAILRGNYASADFLMYDGGAPVDVIDDPDGPDGQTIDAGEAPWFIAHTLHWDTERIWSLKTMRTRPLLARNIECPEIDTRNEY